MANSQLIAIRRTACLFMLLQIILGWPLWWGEQIFPRFSLIGIESNFLLWDGILIGGIVISLLFIAFQPSKLVYSIFIVLAVLAILLDLNRWQPYYHYYGLIIGVYALSSWFASSEKKIHHALLILAAGVYLWSGLQKLNPFYLPGLEFEISKVFGSDTSISSGLSSIIATIPYIEIALAPLILIHQTRRIALWISLGLHAGTLLFLGPIGLNMNPIVWPWNIGMAVVNWFLLRSGPELSLRSMVSLSAVFAVASVWLFPLTNLVSSHFSYQSWSLYSSKVPYGVLVVHDNAIDCIPEDLRNTAYQTSRGYEIYLPLAAEKVSGVIVNPEPAIYKAWADEMCDCRIGRYDVVLELTLYSFSGKQVEYHFCD